jgi:G:T-mismatch repair DNA endonuclease (very short patch repair protein)
LRKCLLLFGISLYVFPHYIYCNCSEEEKRRISFWLLSGNEHAEKDKREASRLNTVLFALFFLEEPLLCIETGT